MSRIESLEETHEALQASVSSWGEKLIATGGALKPSKCFYYLIDFEWLPDGSWCYYRLNDNKQDQFRIEVPLASKQAARIEYLDPDVAQKNLGSMTCPTGNPAKALERMTDLATSWVLREN